MNKARITYRFDETGRETVRKEPTPVIPLMRDEFSVIEDDRPTRAEQPADHSAERGGETERPRREAVDVNSLHSSFTSDFGDWNSPFEAETARIERLIRESSHRDRPPGSKPVERHPAREHGPIEPSDRYGPETGYDVPELADSDRGPGGPLYVSGGRYERHNRTPWLRIITSVAGAVATGVLIGFFVLSMFNGDSGEPGSVATNGRSGANVTGQTAADGGAKDGNAAPAATNVSVAVNIPEQTFTLLQNGVFSSREGAEAAAAELKKKGLAAYVQPGDKFYVYAGLAPSRDDALALSGKLKEGQDGAETELYLKSLTFPATAKIAWSGDQPEQAATFFEQSGKLVDTIAGFAAARLKEQTPAAMDDATWRAIHTAHQAWSGSSAPFGAGLAQEQKAKLQTLETAMNTAVASMDEYKKNASPAFLWQAQTSLMQYLFAENELLAAIRSP